MNALLWRLKPTCRWKIVLWNCCKLFQEAPTTSYSEWADIKGDGMHVR